MLLYTRAVEIRLCSITARSSRLYPSPATCNETAMYNEFVW
jgi:hypothetical protein